MLKLLASKGINQKKCTILYVVFLWNLSGTEKSRLDHDRYQQKCIANVQNDGLQS